MRVLTRGWFMHVYISMDRLHVSWSSFINGRALQKQVKSLPNWKRIHSHNLLTPGI